MRASIGFGILAMVGSLTAGLAQTTPIGLREQAVAPRRARTPQGPTSPDAQAKKQPTPPPAPRSSNLSLPVLGGPSGRMRVLSPQSLYLPAVPETDPFGQPIVSLGDRPAPQQNPNSTLVQPAEPLSAQWTRLDSVMIGARGVIAPTILGYTEDLEPEFYGKTPEETAQTLPTFSVLRSESRAPQTIKIAEARSQSIGLREIRPEAAGESLTRDPNYRVATSMRRSDVIPWSSKANMPQAPAPAAGSGFRLPRAIQSLVNVNLHAGIGIPSYHPNLGAITNSYLGLSGAYNYLSPDIADRLQSQYYQKPNRP